MSEITSKTEAFDQDVYFVNGYTVSEDTYFAVQSLEKERDELREKLSKLPKISQYDKASCADRICVDGVYFGFIDGEWLKAKDQSLAKIRYELGLEGGGE